MASLRTKSNSVRHEAQASALELLGHHEVDSRSIKRSRSLEPMPKKKKTRLPHKKRLSQELERQGEPQQLLSPTSKSATQDAPRAPLSPVELLHSDRKRKRSAESGRWPETETPNIAPALPDVEYPSQTDEYLFSEDRGHQSGKRQRTTPQDYPGNDTKNRELVEDPEDSTFQIIQHWAQEGRWPRQYFEANSDMSLPLTRKRSTPTVSKQTETTPNREWKNPAARNLLYEKTLAATGIFLEKQDGVLPSDESRALCRTLLNSEQTNPGDSLFRDDIFEYTCERVRKRNEAMVLRDITPLIVPSAEVLHAFGAKALKHLTEELNAQWYKCYPLLNGPNPQPDYFAGLKDSAFSEDQLKKLEPFVGNFQRTHFMATEWVHFPFLTCEVKCGQEGLNIADRQNAHSASVAVNGVVELYKVVSRQDELHQEILAFSVSHSHEAVRIYGHYPIISASKTSFHRHLIRSFIFADQDGRDKWTAYKFTKNLYDIFVPIHLKRICSAIDQLPDPDLFSVPPLSFPIQSETSEHDNSQSAPDYSHGSLPRVPSSQTTEPVFKKPKAKGSGE